MTVRRIRRRVVTQEARPREQLGIASRRRIPVAVVESDVAEGRVVPYRGPEFPLGRIIDCSGAELQATRPGEYLHVSDLLSKCIRKRAIHNRQRTVAPARKLTLSDLLTFAQGDAIHDLLKDRARKGRPDAVWGVWSCKCGYLKHEEPCTFDSIDQDEECDHCQTKVTVYHEVPMRDEELGIVGNPDLVLYLKELGAFLITELKSIAAEKYKELVRPLPLHVLQVVFYWYLMNRLGFPLVNKVTIFYATKGWMFGKPYKEFVIDAPAELHRLDDMIEDARAYVASRNGGPLPPRTFCSSPNATEAKKCEVCQTCFALE